MYHNTTSKKLSSYLYGLYAEYCVIIWLSLKGYIFLKRRYKNKFGEIDLIFKHHKKLIFVEVKARKKLLDYINLVGESQKQRIIKAAINFAKKYPKYDLRFDLAIIQKPLYKSQHIQNVW